MAPKYALNNLIEKGLFRPVALIVDGAEPSRAGCKMGLSKFGTARRGGAFPVDWVKRQPRRLALPHLAPNSPFLNRFVTCFEPEGDLRLRREQIVGAKRRGRTGQPPFKCAPQAADAYRERAIPRQVICTNQGSGR